MNEFDLKANTWDNNPMHIDRANAIAQLIKKNIQLENIQVALDYGCGTGLLSFALYKDIKSIILSDSSAGMLEVVDSKIKANQIQNMRTFKSDFNSEILQNYKFDLIFTSMTLHHIEDIQSGLDQFYSLLNRGGYLCIADLDTEDGTFHDDSFTGHFGFNRKELGKTITESGFTGVSFQDCFTISKKNSKGLDQEYSVFLMIAKK